MRGSQTRKFPIGKNYLKVQSIIPNSENSATFNYYQIGEYTLRLKCVLELFTIIIKEPYFDTLRTQEQLGYSVNRGFRNDNSILGFYAGIKSQENQHTTQEVDQRIENFFKVKTPEILGNVTVDEFENFKKSMIKKKSTKDSGLNVEVERNYDEIVKELYEFDRKEQEIAELRNIKLSDLVDFYTKYLKNDENVRKLCIQVVANETGKWPDVLKAQILDAPGNESNYIKNIEDFKNSLEVY